MRQFLSAVVFIAAEYPCPEVRHARVRLNGRDLGLYALVEGTTTRFLKCWFGDGGGNLYEGGADVDSSLDIDGGDRASDFSDLKRLAAAARQIDHGIRIRELAKELDMDRFYSFMALETLTQHWDGYCGSHENYRIYRFVFIPHGMDTTFGMNNLAILHVKKGLVAQAVLETQEGRRKFLERLSVLSSNVFNPQKLEQICRREAAVIRPILVERGEADEFDWALERLIQNIYSQASNICTQATSLLKQENPVLVDLRTMLPPGSMKRLPLVPSASDAPTSGLRGQIFQLSLSVSDSVLDALWRQQGSSQPATLCVNGKDFAVCLRMDEDGLLQSTNRRPGFTVKFEPNEKESPFGVKTLAFRSARSDKSLGRDFIITTLFEKAGVPQPAMGWAVVSVNNMPMGTYVVTEDTTSDYLQRRFGDPKGVLLEGRFADIDVSCLDVDPSCAEKLKELAEAARTDDYDWVARFVDLEKFAGFLATEQFLGIRGYAAGKTSYGIYVHDDCHRVDFIPVIKDHVISRNVRSISENQFAGVLAEFMFRNPRARQIFTKKVAELGESAWSEGSIAYAVSNIRKVFMAGLATDEYAKRDKFLAMLERTLHERAEVAQSVLSFTE